MESIGKERWERHYWSVCKCFLSPIGRSRLSPRVVSRSSTPRQLTANSSLLSTHTTRSVLAWTLTVTKTKTKTQTKTMTTHRYLYGLVITKTLTGNSCYIEGQSILDDNSKRSYKVDVLTHRNLLLAEDNNLSLHSLTNIQTISFQNIFR